MASKAKMPKSCVAPSGGSGDSRGKSKASKFVIEQEDMCALLDAERQERKSEEVLQMYEQVEADEYIERDWMQVTAELQARIARGYCEKHGLPEDSVAQVVHKMRVSAQKPEYAHIGLPQQWPINRARRGNLEVGVIPADVVVRPVVLSPLAPPSVGTLQEVAQPVQFPSDVCRKPYTIVVAGSYS
jgi:hypothetical protein